MVQLKVVRNMSGLARALLAGARTPSPGPLRRRRPASHGAAPRHPSGVHIKRLSAKDASDADDVIDLGAPRARRRDAAPRPRRCFYTPNPRLYPGPERKIVKYASAPRRHPHARVFRRTVPNSRLYRPAPPRPAAPSAAPRAAWPPPPPPARALDTASRAALRLALARPVPVPSAQPQPPKLSKASGRPRRLVRAPPPPSPPRAAPSPPAPRSPARRLVVTLPAAGDAYRPVSEHFRARALPRAGSGASSPAGRLPAMDSASPDDASDGNDSQSAPSEYLAEFLSAIMQRQYAEALKYCRLILQYEPHNATARGFYPLLQQKVAARPRAGREPGRAQDVDSEPSSGSLDEAATMPRPTPQEVMEQEPDSVSLSSARGRSGSSGSAAASSLELDSSPERSERADSASGSVGWESSGSARDDNGNLPAPTSRDADNNAPRRAAPPPAGALAADADPRANFTDISRSEDSAASLRRLRAQFACSIK